MNGLRRPNGINPSIMWPVVQHCLGLHQCSDLYTCTVICLCDRSPLLYKPVVKIQICALELKESESWLHQLNYLMYFFTIKPKVVEKSYVFTVNGIINIFSQGVSKFLGVNAFDTRWLVMTDDKVTRYLWALGYHCRKWWIIVVSWSLYNSFSLVCINGTVECFTLSSFQCLCYIIQ